jgi:hypothetical protein
MTEQKPSYNAKMPNQNLIGSHFRWLQLTATVLAVTANGQLVLMRFQTPDGRTLPRYAAIPLAYLDLTTRTIDKHAPMIIFHKNQRNRHA